MSDETQAIEWDHEWQDPVTKLYMASRGSLIFVLEKKWGQPLSRGHHQIYMRSNELVGRLGALEEIVVLSPNEYIMRGMR